VYSPAQKSTGVVVLNIAICAQMATTNLNLQVLPDGSLTEISEEQVEITHSGPTGVTFVGPTGPSGVSILPNIEINTTPRAVGISSTYDTMVISGGAVRGLLALGALQYLCDNRLCDNVETYVGTSCGSMISYLLAIGYTPVEIMVYLCTHDILEQFTNFDMRAVASCGGAISFSIIQEHLEKMSIEKTGRLFTLGDLQRIHDKRFIAVTYNITESKTEYLTPETHSDLPCITAIRMSSNLPFVFDIFRYSDNFYVDGGLSDNFALEFAENIGSRVVGITTCNANTHEDFDISAMNILSYLEKIIAIPIAQNVEFRIERADPRTKVIRLRGGTSGLNFTIDPRTRLEMFSTGYASCKEQFEQ